MEIYQVEMELALKDWAQELVVLPVYARATVYPDS